MRLKTEIDKLATYVAQRKLIRRQDVTALVISEKPLPSGSWPTCSPNAKASAPSNSSIALLRDGEQPLQMLGGHHLDVRKLIEASE